MNTSIETLSLVASEVRVHDQIYDPEYPGEQKWRPVRLLGEVFGSVAFHMSYRTFTKDPSERVLIRRVG